MRMTSSKCVLHQRHLLGYESEPLPKTLTLELSLILTLFLTLTGTVLHNKFVKHFYKYVIVVLHYLSFA